MLLKLDPYDAENYYRLGVTYQFLQKIEVKGDHKRNGHAPDHDHVYPISVKISSKYGFSQSIKVRT